MNAIKATWKGGRIVPAEPVDWPEGCEVVVEPLPVTAFKIGLDESEWRDDPASLADWDAWLPTIEPLEFTPEEKTAFTQFESQMRQYNIDGVRREMEGKSVP